ncbi:hypothetical protein CIL05_02735 [Virgibacillus profundi]|uniref:PDZ domain-containing protein n=1 Tax=Virgibacillus profundi TaxID=2024555 RepID=A0A2A2IJ87_9BACI|nr:SRPBCC domain-containing protein [Virgibacillus profundi]PAV31592.1 hypothetical protein CIL05_02735 [Virgibacillus profundi]PXY55778.1 PDZ domain-containing protein [Virgibacillus profundi]
MSGIKESIKRDIVVNASIDKIWDALTKPEDLNRWYTKEAKLDFRVGGHCKMVHGWGAETSGTFIDIVQHKKIVLESEDGHFKTITTLDQEKDGVRVTIEYETPFIGEEGEAAKENMAFATFQFLENLKSVYEENQDIRSNMWKAWIGLIHTTNNPAGAESLVDGSKVVHAANESPADAAGIKAKDVITEVDGRPVQSYESLERIINNSKIGGTIALTIVRKKEQITLDCEVAKYPVPY